MARNRALRLPLPLVSNGSQRIFDRRQVLAGDIAVPWIEPVPERVQELA
jgi:hypothetical protein